MADKKARLYKPTLTRNFVTIIMEAALLTEMRDVNRKVDGIEALYRALLKRLNDMASSSGCVGELCDCVSSYKKVQTQMENYLRKATEIETILTEDRLNDIKRDRKIDKIAKRQDEMQTQIERNFKHSRTSKHKHDNVELELVNREEEEDSKETKEHKSNVVESESQTLGKLDQHRGHLGDSRKVTGVSRLVGSNGNTGVLDPTKDVKLPEGKDSETTHIDRIQNSQKGSSYGTASANERLKSSLQTGQSPATNTTEIKHHRNKTPTRPNFLTGSPQEAKPPTSQSTELVPRPDTSMVPKQESSDGVRHEVVNQPNKEYYGTKYVWEVEARAELSKAKKTSLGDLQGVKTILLIDTSSSVWESGGWKETQTFVHDYISGLEECGPKVCNLEYVALITFGAQTRCQQRYTNDMQLVKSTFDRLKLGGPSPLFGGIEMAHATAIIPEDETFHLENGMCVCTKIILMTDGDPTEIRLHSGPDVPDLHQMASTKSSIIAAIESVQKQGVDVFCVPVGKANMEFLHLALAKEGGRKMLNYKDGHYFSRRLFLSMKLVPSFSWFGGNNFAVPRDDPDITASDFAHVHEILDDERIKRNEAIKKRDANPYQESNNERLLKIGSRVRRGPDWGSDDQDGNGPGTVVGHHLYNDKVWVNWDADNAVYLYDYGCMDRYLVFPVDEPRIPLPGQPIEVGCVVCPGKDWSSDVTPAGSKGVVFKVGVTDSGKRKAVVRWENGEKGVYSYGDDRIYEIQICLTEVKGSGNYQSLPTAHVSNPASRSLRQQATPAIEGITITSRPADGRELVPRTNKNKNAQ